MPTKGRMFRVPDEVYEAAQAEARRRGETVTDAVVRSLKRYGQHHSAVTVVRANARGR